VYAFSVKPAVTPLTGATGIFVVADDKPLFNGEPAEIGFRKYLSQTIIYPVNVMEKEITGRVFVAFDIDTDGSVTHAKILSGIDRLLDAEVLRVINSSPKWTPGKKNGKAVKTSYALAVNFTLAGKTQSASSSNTVELPKDAQLLEEVVVTGYGVQKRESVTPREDSKIESQAAAKVKNDKVEAPYQFVEQMPEFVGGEKELKKFLSQNLVYPPEAQYKGIQGTVYLSFVVEVDGSLSKVTVIRGIDPLLDAEALRVVNLMPKWIPGKQNGRTVIVKFTLPIKFPPEQENKKSTTPSSGVKKGKKTK